MLKTSLLELFLQRFIGFGLLCFPSKRTQEMLARMWGKGNPSTLLGNSREVLQKKLNTEILYDPEILLLDKYLDDMKTNSKRYMHSNVYSTISYSL